MTPYQLALEAENAYDNRDRTAFQRAVARLVVLAESNHRAWPEALKQIAQQDPQPIEPSEE